MNEVLYQRPGNILKQLHLSGINTKHFFKGVLCLKDKERKQYTAHMNGIQQKMEKKSYNYHPHHHALNMLISNKIWGLYWMTDV